MNRYDLRNQPCDVWPGWDPDSLSADFGWRYTRASPYLSETITYDETGNRTDKGGSYTTGNRVVSLNGVSLGA